MAIDIWEVIEAAKNQTFRVHAPFYPDRDSAVTAFPSTPFIYHWKARGAFQCHNSFHRTLHPQINAAMPAIVITRLAEELDQRFSEGLNGASSGPGDRFYKKNVDDMRESPTLN